MNSISEIPKQNSQDAWSMLYLALAAEWKSNFGLSGEELIREAIRESGIRQGRERRNALAAAGYAADVKALFNSRFGLARDPRLKESVLEETSQVRRFEVYLDPVAGMFLKKNRLEEGFWFYQEYLYGIFSGYTAGVGQMHINRIMTCPRDLYGEYACLIRPANQSEAEAKITFGGESAPSGEADLPAFLEELTAYLIGNLYLATAERFQQAADDALSRAFRSYCKELIVWLTEKAKATASALNRNYLQNNTAFPLAEEKFESLSAAPGATKLYGKQFLAPMLRYCAE